MYGPSQLAWNFLFARLAVFLKILLKTNSPALNVRGFTCRLCKFANRCWYDAMRTIAASQSSSVLSWSLVMSSKIASSGISVWMVGILIFVGMIASIPYVRANGDSRIWFRLVVLYVHNTPGSSSTHFPFVECRSCFRADRSVLLYSSSWPLLCGYRRVEYRFLIFSSL